MKIQNINFENIKIVIFDFDDTLAVHKDKDFRKHRRESEDKYLEYYLNAYQNQNTFYENIEPCIKSEVLYNLIIKLRKKGIKMYCLSGMRFSFHLKAKQVFINKHYGNDIEVIATASQELKVDGAKIIQKIENCRLDEILFIDDRQDTVDLLNKSGIKSVWVNDIEV